MDIRQSENWGQYLSAIGWKVEKLGPEQQAFIRTIPLLNRSIIKIQHPQNPLPFEKIDRMAKRDRALFVLIEPSDETYQESLFVNHGYQRSTMSLTHTATIQLDLQQPLDQLWSSFSENARRNIRKAEQQNLKVETVVVNEKNAVELLSRFYPLFKNLTKLKKFYIPSYQESLKKVQALGSYSILLFAYPASESKTKLQEPIAAVWLVVIKDRAYYLNTGITPTGYQLLANYLLVWEALKLSHKLGAKIFDFEGTFDPRFPKKRQSWVGLTEFKLRFHGTTILFPQAWMKFYSWPFKLFYLCSKIFGQ